MAVPIAELFVSVSADVNAAIAGLTALGTQLNATQQRFQQAAPAALLLAGAGAAVGAELFSAVKTAASFEQAMANVRAVMTPDEARTFGSALGDLAIQLGKDTVFSAREAAAGIGELIRAGIPAEAVLGGAAAAALNLASATGISVADAATVAAQTMNAFHLQTSQLTGVVDTLAGTANATAATMTDLQFGLQIVSATAQTMGLSFQDTSAAIGLFVSAGQTGATAGTGLRQMLLELIPTTKPATEEMRALGIITADGSNAFFDAAGHVKDLAGIAQVLQVALRGMSDEQRIAALNTLFTRDAINSATILASQGAVGVRALTDEISKISAAETAAIRLGTLEGALNNLGSSFETVQIIVGNLFLPTLRELANGVRGIVDQFSSLPPDLQRAVVLFGAMGGAAAALIGGFVLLAPFIATLPVAFGHLGAAVAAATPLFLPLIAVAALLVGAWQADLLGIQGIARAAFTGLPALLEGVTRIFQDAGRVWGTTIVPAIQLISNELERRLIPIFDAIITNPFFQNFGLAVQKLFAGDFSGAVDTFLAILGALVPGLGTLTQQIRSTVSGFFDAVGPVLGNLGVAFTKLLEGDLAGAFDTLRAIIGALLPDINPLLDALAGLATTVGATVRVAFAGLLSAITPVAQAIARWASSLAQSVDSAGIMRTVLGLLTGSIRAFATFLQGATAFVQEHGQAIGTLGAALAGGAAAFLLIQGALAVWAGVLEVARVATVVFTAAQVALNFALTANPIGIIIVALGALAGAFAFLFATNEGFRTSVDGLWQGLQNLLGAIAAVAGDVGQQLLGFFVAASDLLNPLVVSVGAFFTALGNLLTALGALGGTAAAGLFENVLIPGFQALLAAIQPLAAVVQPLMDTVFTPMFNVFTALGPIVQGLAGFFQNAAAAIQGLADAFVNLRNNLPPWLTPGSGISIFGNPAGGPQVIPSGFNLAGAGAGGAGTAIISIGQVVVTNEADEDRFMQKLAGLLVGGANRVNPPPDNSGFPTIRSTGVV